MTSQVEPFICQTCHTESLVKFNHRRRFCPECARERVKARSRARTLARPDGKVLRNRRKGGHRWKVSTELFMHSVKRFTFQETTTKRSCGLCSKVALFYHPRTKQARCREHKDT